MKPTIYAAALVISYFMGYTENVSAAEPGWSPVIIARGEYKEQIKSLPMEQRPYRPLHFYGNTVRRMHYRGTPMIAIRDIVNPIAVGGNRVLGQ